MVALRGVVLVTGLCGIVHGQEQSLMAEIIGRPLTAGEIKAGLAGTAGLMASAFALRSLRVVPPARVGVVSVLGKVAKEPLQPGLHVVNPLSSVTHLSTKTMLFEQANDVPTREGVMVRLDVAVLFHIDPSRAPHIFMTIGENFVQTIIAPEVASAVRGLTSESDASALYTVGRLDVQSRLKSELAQVLEPRGIIVEAVLLKDVDLPELLTDAIERKAQAEQEAERMLYIIQRERQEADRKEIEAAGIAQFQKLVSEGITQEMLMWKGIEVTHEIATSDNAKVVIVGNSGSSLPILLGDGWGGASTVSPDHISEAHAKGQRAKATQSSSSGANTKSSTIDS